MQNVFDAWEQDPRSEDQIVADIAAAGSDAELLAAIPGDAEAKAAWAMVADHQAAMRATGWSVCEV